MTVDVSAILKLIGPSATIIFAAWIFMGFLQQRYDSAVHRYRATIRDYRDGHIGEVRRENVRDQVMSFRRRCGIMLAAILVGLASAILLIVTLIAAELSLLFSNDSALKYLSAFSALAGFALVIIAAALVMGEAWMTKRQFDAELMDVPELASSIGEAPGQMTNQDRR